MLHIRLSEDLTVLLWDSLRICCRCQSYIYHKSIPQVFHFQISKYRSSTIQELLQQPNPVTQTFTPTSLTTCISSSLQPTITVNQNSYIRIPVCLQLGKWIFSLETELNRTAGRDHRIHESDHRHLDRPHQGAEDRRLLLIARMLPEMWMQTESQTSEIDSVRSRLISE